MNDASIDLACSDEDVSLLEVSDEALEIAASLDAIPTGKTNCAGGYGC